MPHQPAGDFDYDAHGSSYAQHRRADPRIAAHLHAALGNARTVLNVGAGTGSYEPLDRYVVAIEPSEVMRSQRPPHLAGAIPGVAEALPFADQSFDASMALITVHQWSDLARGLSEIRRVTRGPVLVLTLDGTALDRYWLADYVPELVAIERARFPKLQDIRAHLGGTSHVRTILTPIDCTDGFAEAYYARPEQFLDSAVRTSQSGFGFLSQPIVARFVAALQADLKSGKWDEHHGHLRQLPMFEGSLRLIIAHPLSADPA